MPTLTLEAIRENPWNAVTHELPPHPDRLLLRLARLASDYCRASENMLMLAARTGDYTPAGWEPVSEACDVHEESEARAYDADRKLDEIDNLYLKEFGELPE